MTIVNMLEAKSSLSRLVSAVESGEVSEIFIARNGKPAARLVALEARLETDRPLGLLTGKSPAMSLEDFNATDADVAHLFNVSES